MISVDEAQGLVEARGVQLAPCKVALADALGLVLAEDIASDIDSPPYDKALVDGHHSGHMARNKTRAPVHRRGGGTAMKIASVAEVKSQFSAFLKASAGRPVVVTRKGLTRGHSAKD